MQVRALIREKARSNKVLQDLMMVRLVLAKLTVKTKKKQNDNKNSLTSQSVGRNPCQKTNERTNEN